jgi:homoserine O-acetyltransferase
MFEIDFKFSEPFTLESGEILSPLDLRCTIYGKLNAEKSNAVLVFHALTGSSRVNEWWNEILGDGLGLDTARFAFVCVNALGSCYGSTPGKFIKSVVTTGDIVRSQKLLFEYLGIGKFRAVVGSSVGGMLALQFATHFPELTEKCVAVGAAPLSAMGLALNHLQRAAIKHENGVGLARQIAMISYKSSELFERSFARRPNQNGEIPSARLQNRFDIAGYLDYQGEKFTRRFDAESYIMLSKVMDLFDLSDAQIEKITARVSLVGITSDWLFPASDVENLTERMKNLGIDAEYVEMISPDGHDAFLSDTGQMSDILKRVLATENTAKHGDNKKDCEENAFSQCSQ